MPLTALFRGLNLWMFWLVWSRSGLFSAFSPSFQSCNKDDFARQKERHRSLCFLFWKVLPFFVVGDSWENQHQQKGLRTKLMWHHDGFRRFTHKWPQLIQPKKAAVCRTKVQKWGVEGQNLKVKICLAVLAFQTWAKPADTWKGNESTHLHSERRNGGNCKETFSHQHLSSNVGGSLNLLSVLFLAIFAANVMMTLRNRFGSSWLFCAITTQFETKTVCSRSCVHWLLKGKKLPSRLYQCPGVILAGIYALFLDALWLLWEIIGSKDWLPSCRILAQKRKVLASVRMRPNEEDSHWGILINLGDSETKTFLEFLRWKRGKDMKSSLIPQADIFLTIHFLLASTLFNVLTWTPEDVWSYFIFGVILAWKLFCGVQLWYQVQVKAWDTHNTEKIHLFFVTEHPFVFVNLFSPKVRNWAKLHFFFFPGKVVYSLCRQHKFSLYILQAKDILHKKSSDIHNSQQQFQSFQWKPNSSQSQEKGMDCLQQLVGNNHINPESINFLHFTSNKEQGSCNDNWIARQSVPFYRPEEEFEDYSLWTQGQSAWVWTNRGQDWVCRFLHYLRYMMWFAAQMPSCPSAFSPLVLEQISFLCDEQSFWKISFQD